MSKMKKRLIALLVTALVLGIGTSAIASSDSEIFEDFSFEKMLPFMKQMHPDMDKEELEEMFERCHGENGMMNRMEPEQRNEMMNRMMNGEKNELMREMHNKMMNGPMGSNNL